MPPLSCRLVLLGFCLLLAARGADVPQLPPAQVAAIDAIFAPFNHAGSPGYAIGVVRGGELVFARGYGRANLDYDQPITPTTAFHLAAASKQFTAAAIALLIMDGKLSLETPVLEFFPDLAHFQADLRVKHLMYHTSGLPDYVTQRRPGGWSWFSFDYFNTTEAVSATMRAPALRFAPGTRWEYFNVNFMLLAIIVERVSAMPFADFLELRVFAPLGMQQTHVNDDPTLIVPGRATGYVDRADPPTRQQLEHVGLQLRQGKGYAQMLRVSPHYGDSGVFSSIEDLARWDANFTTFKLAGRNFTGQMLQRMKFAHAKDNDAFGLVFGRFQGREMIMSSGADLDSSVFIGRLPAEQLTVICLSNIATGDAEGKASKVLSILLPTAPAKVPAAGK